MKIIAEGLGSSRLNDWTPEYSMLHIDFITGMPIMLEKMI